jgi:hypothetical protein
MSHNNFYIHLFLSSLSHEKLYENKEFIITLVKEKNINVNDVVLEKIMSIKNTQPNKKIDCFDIPDELIVRNIHQLLMECGLNLNNDIYELMRDKIIYKWNTLSQEITQPLKDTLSMFELCLKEPMSLLKTSGSKYSSESKAVFYCLLEKGNIDLFEICLNKLNIASLDENKKDEIKFNIFKNLSHYCYDGKSLPKLIRILDENNLIKLDTKESRILILKHLFPETNGNVFNKIRGLFNSKVGKKYFNSNELLEFITNGILELKNSLLDEALIELKKTYNKIDKSEINYSIFVPKLEEIFSQPNLRVYNQQLKQFSSEVEKDRLNLILNSETTTNKKTLKL